MLNRPALLFCIVLWVSSLKPFDVRSENRSAREDLDAIVHLGYVDICKYPQAQQVLIETLRNDRREIVRDAAVLAMTRQLERGRFPLDPMSGWRQVPDPEICAQVVRLTQLQEPLTRKELSDCYRLRQELHLRQIKQGRCNAEQDFCTPELISILARTAFERDWFENWSEPSPKIRWRAERALTLCCSAADLKRYQQRYSPQSASPSPFMLGHGAPSPVTPTDPDKSKASSANDTPAKTESSLSPLVSPSPVQPNEEILPAIENLAIGSDLAMVDSGYQGNYTFDVPILGRADYSNRFNIFDNMSPAPRSRIWYGFQFVQSQNNGVIQTADTTKLFSVLNSTAGRAQFISLTGFGRQPGEPAVNPADPASKDELERQFLTSNGGRSQKYLLSPDSDLHRFGAEWALTADFSLSVMGQYVMPQTDNEQPSSFSNPSVQVKHVLYRDEETLISGVFNIQPQISRPKFSIGEDTTRLSVGVMVYHQLSDRLFTQSIGGLSFPTEANQITTFDYALGGGYWAYRHESLQPYFRGVPPDNWILGFIPQFELLGKTILGNNLVLGNFDLKEGTALTAPGTVSPVDGSRNIYFPQDFTRFQQSSFIYRETRDNVDLTFGASTIFTNNFVHSAAVSIPVTGGNARAVEFITSLNKYF